MSFCSFAVNYLNQNFTQMTLRESQDIIEHMDCKDLSDILLNDDLDIKIRNEITTRIIKQGKFLKHVNKRVLESYFLCNIGFDSVLNKDIETLFQAEFVHYFKESIDLSDAVFSSILPMIHLIDKKFVNHFSIKNCANIQSLNINVFASEEYHVIDFFFDIILMKESKIEQQNEFNHFISLFLDIFTSNRFTFDTEAFSTIFKKNFFLKIKSFILEHNLEYLLSNIDLDFICNSDEVTERNARFSEFEIGALFLPKNKKLIELLYLKKREFFNNSSLNFILRLCCSLDIDDHVYIEYLIEDIKNKFFDKGTVFFFDPNEKREHYIHFNIIEHITESGYHINFIDRSFLQKAKNKKDLFFKILLKNDCQYDINNILSNRDYFYLKTIDINIDKSSGELKIFIIDNFNVLFDNELNLSKEGKELIELNFIY